MNLVGCHDAKTTYWNFWWLRALCMFVWSSEICVCEYQCKYNVYIISFDFFFLYV